MKPPLNPDTTVRTYITYDTDIQSGTVVVVEASTEPSTPTVAVRDTGRRVFQCHERAADTLELQKNGRLIQVESNDGARTANVYLTRESARELAGALLALADG